MKERIENSMKIKFRAISQNESFSRIVITGFISGANPTVEELADVKTAVSEAVTNCVVHAYRGTDDGTITMEAKLFASGRLWIAVSDKGCGIEDIAKARQPLYTTDPENERSGMGFSIMETFTDKIKVTSKPGRGTRVVMQKTLKRMNGSLC